MSVSTPTSSAAFPGPTTSQADAVHVFDLDGTVLTINSFPVWVRYLMKGGDRRAGPLRRLATSAATAWAVLERKLFGRSHQRFKSRLQAIAGTAVPDAAFLDDLMAHVEPKLVPALQLVAGGEIDAILATAAAEEYAVALAERLSFRHVLATPRRRAHEAENVGPTKRQAVVELVDQLGWSSRPLVVYTDHLEDAPLASLATHLVWCGDHQEGRALRQQHRSIASLVCLKAPVFVSQ